MGWYGNYQNSREVLDEHLRNAQRNGWAIIDSKLTATTGAYIAERDGQTAIALFIFEGGMYKPLSAVDRWSFVPAAWKTLYRPFMSRYELDAAEAEMAHRAAAAADKKAVNNMLVAGKTYAIYNGAYIGVYAFKDRQGHVFSVDGQYTRFKDVRPDNISLIEEIA